MDRKIFGILFFVIYLSLCFCQSTKIFYSPNSQDNSVYSLNIDSSSNITLNNNISTQEYGDGSGLAGPSRCSAQNTAQNENFIFVANEGSQSISVFGFDISGNFDLRSSIMVVDPLVQNIEDLSLVTSIDNKWLFVGVSNFLDSNLLKSYSIDNVTGDLNEIYSYTFGVWEEAKPLPLRISSVTVSPDSNFVFVGFTSNGGYLAVFRINSDGTLGLVGNVKQTVLNGKTSYYTIANNETNLVYTAQGNEATVGVGIYQFNNGNLLQLISTINYPLSGSATTLSISPDGKLFFITTKNKVIVMPINSTNGIPDSSNATIIYSSESCLSVVGISVRKCGRIIVVNTDGFGVYQRVSSNNITMQNEWRLGIESVGGAAIIDGNETCCSVETVPVINAPSEIIIDCSLSIPTTPPFSVSGSYDYIIQQSTQIQSTCNGRPNIIFNITVIDECGRSVSSTIKYIRKDSTPPSVQLAGGNNFYVECGDTIPTFNFNFISVVDDCSPLLIACSNITNSTRFECVDKKVGTANIKFTYFDSSNNSSPQLVQSIDILDTTPPFFSPFNQSLSIFNSTCQPDLNLAPSVVVADKCSNYTLSSPQLFQRTCGLYEIVWNAEDECENKASTSYFFSLPLQTLAPNITSLSSTLFFYLTPNISNSFDLQQGNNLTLSSFCQSNFPLQQLFGNEETSVTITSQPSTFDGSFYYQIFTATWKIVYCGNSSSFVQTITVQGSQLSDFTNIIWKTLTPRFVINKL